MLNNLHSYVTGSSDQPLLQLTIGQLLEQTLKRFPDREAVVAPEQNTRWTYSQFNHHVNRFALGLIQLGLKPGERIGIWSPNNCEWLITQFASAKAGLILVNINPAYRASELDYCLNKVGCKALVLTHQFKTSNYVSIMNQLAPQIVHGKAGDLSLPRLPKLKIVILIDDNVPDGYLSFSEVMNSSTENPQPTLSALADQLRPDDAINIQFTSGTTGSPKGATLTHNNIVNNGYFSGQGMSLTEQDKICLPVPLYHCFGMVLGVLASVSHGACVVMPSESFEPQSVLASITKEKCTALYGVPTMLSAILDHPHFSTFDLSSLRTGIMAGATCPITLMHRVISDMHMAEVTICYGMTETSPVSFQTRIGDSIEKRTTTVGKIHPHLEAKIVNEHNQIIPVGSKGEICTRGYSVMPGYWNDEKKTREAIDAGDWMHTGDLGIIDDEGYCSIVGRLKDMIIRGGENIYPREVEEFLYQHPAIADVQVFGVPDSKMGEQVCVWIKLQTDQVLTDNDITLFCKEKIAHYKTPQHIRFVTEFPMTITGKIQKYLMREEMMQELQLSEQT